MGFKENNLKNKHDRTLTKWQRLWRINNGVGWVGEVIHRTTKQIILKKPFRFRAIEKGLHADQIGFDSMIITPDMVGKRVAVFVACEIKATGGLSDDQVKTRDLVVKMGGIHREVRGDRVVESGFLSPD